VVGNLALCSRFRESIVSLIGEGGICFVPESNRERAALPAASTTQAGAAGRDQIP